MALGSYGAATEHAVHFYERDADLQQTAGRFLAEALAAGGVGIAIATEAHRRALAVELEAGGFDVAGAVDDGRLVFLDAARTLARFAQSGRMDPVAFEWSVGQVLRGAVERGTPVHAFGEMVALLWEPGDVPGAIELEELWNRLREEIPFSLLCGYRRSSVCSPEHGEALEQVCHLHSAIRGAEQESVGGEVVEARYEFLPERETPRSARWLLSRVLAEAGCADEGLQQDAHLVTSELVTNAVLHARSPVLLAVRCEPSRLRLEVQDFSASPPGRRSAGTGGPGMGMGMELVASLASRWGIEPGRHGKTVWAELRLSPTRGA